MQMKFDATSYCRQQATRSCKEDALTSFPGRLRTTVHTEQRWSVPGTSSEHDTFGLPMLARARVLTSCRCSKQRQRPRLCACNTGLP